MPPRGARPTAPTEVEYRVSDRVNQRVEEPDARSAPGQITGARARARRASSVGSFAMSATAADVRSEPE